MQNIVDLTFISTQCILELLFEFFVKLSW